MKLEKALKQVLIVAGASLSLGFNSFAQSSNEPRIRGDYFVCPNGKVLPREYWSTKRDNTQLAHGKIWDSSVDIDGEIVVDSSYYPNADEIGRQLNKIFDGKGPPASYSLKEVKKNFTGQIDWIIYINTYKLASSDGKVVSIRLNEPAKSGTIKRSNGDVISFGRGEFYKSSLKCSGDFMVVRLIDYLGASHHNEYGEILPLHIYFVRELTFRTLPPPSPKPFKLWALIYAWIQCWLLTNLQFHWNWQDSYRWVKL